MDRRFRTLLAASLVLSAAGLAAPLAHAAPKDAAAQKLVKKAMEDDFLATKWDDAEKKLRDALNQCGASGCSPNVKADIYMNLGIILVNAKKNADATAAFAEGLKVDPNAAPNKDYTSDDVQKAFDAAKGGGAKPAPTGGGGDQPPPGDKPQGGGKEAQNDLKYEPITEAMADFPVPIWVGAMEGASKFMLFFKPFGGSEFNKIEMKKMGRGFGAEIPCGNTSTTGPLKYYIQALDSGGDVVASAGSRKAPLEIKIQRKIAGEQPAFPGKDPPEKCKMVSDCPPGMENDEACGKKGGVGKSEGDSCSSDSPCGGLLMCVEGTCRSEEGAAGGPIKKNLLSISVALDDAIVSSGEVCSADNYDSGVFNCFRQDQGNRLYQPGNPNSAGYGSRDKGTVAGLPFAVGTIRVLLGYDRVIVNNFALGVRVGYAFNGGPATPGAVNPDGTSQPDKNFLAFHGELRGTYWIGRDVLGKVGVRPFVFLGGGAGQVDAKIGNVPVSDDCAVVNPASCPAKGDPNYGKKISVDAWRRMGQGFVGAGGGIVYAINKTSGLLVEVKASYFFPTTGIAVSPTLGFMQQL